MSAVKSEILGLTSSLTWEYRPKALPRLGLLGQMGPEYLGIDPFFLINAKNAKTGDAKIRQAPLRPSRQDLLETGNGERGMEEQTSR